MKLNDEALIGLFVTCTFIFFAALITGGFLMKMEQNRTYKNTYNKNMECRVAFQGNSPSQINDYCGELPKIGDYVR
jgi:uncharacterized protein YcsI (UPF0317 family)